MPASLNIHVNSTTIYHFSIIFKLDCLQFVIQLVAINFESIFIWIIMTSPMLLPHFFKYHQSSVAHSLKLKFQFFVEEKTSYRWRRFQIGLKSLCLEWNLMTENRKRNSWKFGWMTSCLLTVQLGIDGCINHQYNGILGKDLSWPGLPKNNWEFRLACNAWWRQHRAAYYWW